MTEPTDGLMAALAAGYEESLECNISCCYDGELDGRYFHQAAHVRAWISHALKPIPRCGHTGPHADPCGECYVYESVLDALGLDGETRP